MLPDLKAKWLAALRGGQYHQGTHLLRNSYDVGSYGYCCLGVLCDVKEPIGWHNDYCPQHSMSDDDGGELNHKALDELCITSEQMLTLIAMNDGSVTRQHGSRELVADFEGNQQSFAQIADWIEANL